MANDTLTIRVLRFLPKNLISRGFGWIARLERPRFFVRPFMRWFANRFQIDFEEAAKRFEDYPSLLAMFTRELKEGVRPINQDRGVLVNPVDGRVGAYGRIERGRLVQAKGMDYSLEALLGSAEAAEPFAGGRFATIYLSPRDYHRLHSPDDAKIERTLYEPGKLWPVNAAAVKNVPSLFAVNERVTAFLATERAPLAFVIRTRAPFWWEQPTWARYGSPTRTLFPTAVVNENFLSTHLRCRLRAASTWRLSNSDRPSS